MARLATADFREPPEAKFAEHLIYTFGRIRACADRGAMAFVESGRGMPDHPGSPLSFPKEGARARRPTIHHRAHGLPTVQSLSPREQDEPPFGLPPSPYPRHRVVFEKLVQVLVFGCAYEKIADGSCSATTLRDRRDEWIELGGDRAAARDDARSLRSGHRPGSLGAGGRLLHHESALRGREGRKEPGGPWQAGPQAFGGR
jgi:hypothetical protein